VTERVIPAPTRARGRFAAERARQIEGEGRFPAGDVGRAAELLRAAACYETASKMIAEHPLLDFIVKDAPLDWPWRAELWKPASARRMREKAAALAIAAIDAMVAEDNSVDDIGRARS
jgi:hypothetical protein